MEIVQARQQRIAATMHTGLFDSKVLTFNILF